MADDVKLNTYGLDQLMKALKDNSHKARVGVLGGKTIRKEQKIGETNASIGAVHEFGMGNMPQRSFLRVPIAEHLKKEVENAEMFGKDELKQVVEEGSLVPWLKRLGVIGERIVAKAFATGGFGKWPAWKTPGYKNDDNRLLVDTRQLRDSITSDVK